MTKTEQRIKQLMEQVGMPDSMSLFQAFKQFALEQEIEVERLKAERQKLDRRIRNQRLQLRMDWQILESRINFISRITKEGRSSYLAQISRWRDRALAAEARLKEIA